MSAATANAVEVSVRLIGPFALWGALFFGDPDIADGIIYWLMH